MVARAFASGTSVSPEKSKAEIDALLGKHGAGQRGIIEDSEHGRAVVAFVIRDRQYRVEVPMPREGVELPDPLKSDHAQKVKCPPRWWSMGTAQRKAWVERQRTQMTRERWRAVLLVLKSKLELVRIGASTIESEFLSSMVIKGGRTVGQIIDAQMEQIMSGHSPRLLPEAT